MYKVLAALIEVYNQKNLEESSLHISLLKNHTELKYHKNYIRNILNNAWMIMKQLDYYSNIIICKNHIKGYK